MNLAIARIEAYAKNLIYQAVESKKFSIYYAFKVKHQSNA
jgi:hypothetical protein